MVSVIITTKNESAHIESCLKSIKRQTFHDIEIIVVDNGSHDKTKEIAKQFTKHVFDTGPERSAQRNFGTKKAKGEYLLFLDADMELTPTVVQEAVNLFQVTGDELNNTTRNTQTRNIDTRIIAVVIPEKSFGIGFWAQCKALERSFYLGVPWIESARFFEKEAFHTIGGYDEKLTGPEDFELPQRLKLMFGENCVGRISAFIRHNEGKLTLGKTLRKKYLYGKNMRLYSQKKSSEGYVSKQGNILERYKLFFSKSSIILHNPIVFIGMLIMKTLEMGAIIIGSLA